MCFRLAQGCRKGCPNTKWFGEKRRKHTAKQKRRNETGETKTGEQNLSLPRGRQIGLGGNRAKRVAPIGLGGNWWSETTKVAPK